MANKKLKALSDANLKRSYESYLRKVKAWEDKGYIVDRHYDSIEEYALDYNNAIKKGTSKDISSRLAREDRFISYETARKLLPEFNKRQKKLFEEQQANLPENLRESFVELKFTELLKGRKKSGEALLDITPIKIKNESGEIVEFFPTSQKQALYLLQKYNESGEVMVGSDGKIKADIIYGY
jgi:hypothetical protein